MKRETNCAAHGRQGVALACIHVAIALDSGESVGFHWDDAFNDLGRPDAWCKACDDDLVRLGDADPEGWFRRADFKFLCVGCWDEAKEKLYRAPG